MVVEPGKRDMEADDVVNVSSYILCSVVTRDTLCLCQLEDGKVSDIFYNTCILGDCKVCQYLWPNLAIYKEIIKMKFLCIHVGLYVFVCMYAFTY